MRVTLFLKIFASYLILVVLAIAVMDFVLVPKIKDTVTKSIEEEMRGNASMMSIMSLENIRNQMQAIAAQTTMRVTLIDPAGRVLADSQADFLKMDNHLTRPEVQQAKTEGYGKASRFSVTLQESMLYIALPIRENSNIKAYVRVARPLAKVTESLDHLNKALYLTLYIIAIPSLLLAAVFSGRITSLLDEKDRKILR